MTLRYPIIISDSPTVTLIPRPGATLRVTEVGVDALREALEGPRFTQITEYTSRRLEVEHGVKLPPTEYRVEGAMYRRQITLNANSPTSPIKIYLTEIEYPS